MSRTLPQGALIVGDGGFGCSKVAPRIKRGLLKHCGEMPTNIRFELHDTATSKELLAGPQPEISQEDLFLTEADRFLLEIDAGPTLAVEAHPEVFGTVPKDVLPLLRDPNVLRKGARAIRSLAFAAFLWNWAVIRNRLTEAIHSLRSFHAAMGGEDVGNLLIFVIFSSAGGTGSAIGIPVGYALKSLRADGLVRANLSVVAEVAHANCFVGCNDRHRANTYQFLMELAECHRPGYAWKRDFFSEEPVQDRPFDLVYHFGRDNGAIAFGTADEVADVVAEHILTQIL